MIINYLQVIHKPHLDYGDVVYDQAHKENAELDLEFRKARRWFRRLCYFYQFKSYCLPTYLF